MEKLNKNTKTKQCTIPSVSNSLPTKWASIEEIETWVGDLSENKGGRARLTVTHYCGDNKSELVSQLKTLIDGLENGFESFDS